MGLMDRLFGKKAKETEQPPIVNNKRIEAKSFTTLVRKDGTSIDIMPALDSMGRQTYGEIGNTGKLLPKFIISSQEVQRFARTDFTSVLIDIDRSLLDTPEGRDLIANVLLNSQRMEKVINTYGGYAGGLFVNKNGNLDKYVDQDIINALKLPRQQQMQAFRANLSNRNVDSHSRQNEEIVME